MPSRVVSLASLLLVVGSVVAFLGCAWGIMTQRIGAGDGAMALGAWMLTGVVFAFRYSDPKWLEPLSIVKKQR